MQQSQTNQWDYLSSGYREKILTPFANKGTTDFFFSLLTPEDLSGKIIDAGCGNGYFVQELLLRKTLEFKPVCLDLSQQMLASAASVIGNSAYMIRAELNALPFLDSSFDRAFAINSILSDKRFTREKSMSELYRVLSPKGKLFLLLPALENYLEQLHIIREQFVTDGLDEQQAIWSVYDLINERFFDPIGGYVNILGSSLRIKLYTHSEIELILRNSGFYQFEIKKYTYSYEHCAQAGLACNQNGLFDWFIVAQR